MNNESNQNEYNFVLPLEDTVTGLHVRGRLIAPVKPVENPLGIVIIVPGFLGYMDWGFYPFLAKTLVERGFAVIQFDHSTGGVGDNGKPYSGLDKLKHMTVERDLADMRRIFEAVNSGEIDGITNPASLPVFLVGHSKGGAVSLLSASGQSAIAGIVLINSVADLLRIPREKALEIIEKGHQEKQLPGTKITIKVDCEYWKQILDNPERYDPIMALEKLTAKLFIIRGSADEVITFEETKRIIHAASKGTPIILRDGVDHNLGCNAGSGKIERNGYVLLLHVGQWISRTRDEFTASRS